ncbi:MAG: hypothetical protein ABI481_02105 [Pyrinomonadaceae bacterium]
MKRTFLGFAVVLFLASLAIADVPRPDKPNKPDKSIDTSMTIRLDRNAHDARLIIPRAQIQQLRAQLDEIGGSDDSAAATGTFTRTQTIVSGTLLSLAFVFGGMWFAKSGRAGSKGITAAVMILTLGSIATLVLGNAGPPPEARSITGKMFSDSVHMYKFGSGAIKLEVSDTEQMPELIVPDPPKTASE